MIYLALGIIYFIGIFFTYFVDKTMLKKGMENNIKHTITIALVWVFSPIFMLGLILVTISFFLIRKE